MASRQRFRIGDRVHTVAVDEQGDRLVVTVDDGDPLTIDATVSGLPGMVSMIVDERPTRAHVARDGAGFRVAVDGRVFHVESATSPTRSRGSVGGAADPPGKISAPLAGVVVEVRVAVGEAVEEGQTAVVVEAMKMQNEVHVQHPGVITAVHCSAGSRVEKGELLVEYEVADDPA